MSSRDDWSFYDELFSDNELPFVTARHGSQVEPGVWYRLDRWTHDNYFRINTTWGPDWKIFQAGGLNHEVPVAGVTFNDGEIEFMRLVGQPDFRMYLERDPHNRHDRHAIKVMVRGTLRGKSMTDHIGFVPAKLTQRLSHEPAIDVRPYAVHLATADRKFGIRVRILVRSNRWRVAQRIADEAQDDTIYQS